MLLRWILVVPLIFFLPGTVAATLDAVGRWWAPERLHLPILAGLALGSIAESWIARHFPRFHTFEHELSHALVALLCGRRITRFVATSQNGGVVRHTGGSSALSPVADTMISISPYCLPTLMIPAVVALRFSGPEWKSWLTGAAAATLAFHLVSNVRETVHNFHRRAFGSADNGELTRSDIAKLGFVFFLLVIAPLSILTHGPLIAVAQGGFGGLQRWGRVVESHVPDSIRVVMQTGRFLRAYIDSFVSRLGGL